MTVSRKFYLIALLILIALLALFALLPWDYTLSIAIYNSHSIWAEFFNMFGEVPLYGGFLLATTILFGSRNRLKSFKYYVLSVLGVVFMLLFSVITPFMPIRYVFEFAEGGIPTIWMVIAIIIGLIIFSLMFFWTKKKDRKVFVAMKKEAVVLILLGLYVVISVNVLKMIWGRPRMRSIDSIDEFRYWYDIRPFAVNEEFKSFPSGHTANGMMMFAYIMFIDKIKWIKSHYFMAFALLWGVFGALARVVLGAHFFTDVIVALYITIFGFAWIHSMVFKNKKRAISK
ncbi:MAG: phosphatase PAP2 family protein [Acholeplasmataceae bacterium]